MSLLNGGPSLIAIKSLYTTIVYADNFHRHLLMAASTQTPLTAELISSDEFKVCNSNKLFSLYKPT
jgi:hypothetical protein